MFAKLALLLYLSIASLAYASQTNINFRIIYLNQLQISDRKSIQESIQAAAEVFNKNCSLNLSFSTQESHLPISKALLFDHSWKSYKIDQFSAPQYFRFLQHSIYEISKANKIFRNKKEIILFVRSGLERETGGTCGFAFPKIQFLDQEARHYQSEKFLQQTGPLLFNRIIIDSPAGAFNSQCGDYQRMLAHEVAHLLVQDSPPHLCQDFAGSVAHCPPFNLISDYDFLDIGPGRRDPWKPEPEESDPFGSERRVKAFGTLLTSQQCLSIKNTLIDF